jgi:hypothetical protein
MQVDIESHANVKYINHVNSQTPEAEKAQKAQERIDQSQPSAPDSENNKPSIDQDWNPDDDQTMRTRFWASTMEEKRSARHSS